MTFIYFVENNGVMKSLIRLKEKSLYKPLIKTGQNKSIQWLDFVKVFTLEVMQIQTHFKTMSMKDNLSLESV